MNKQSERGIEWTEYTWNPVGGCHHGCSWVMPDGGVAVCYAEDMAIRNHSATFYPHGFEHHYWHPERLEEPLALKTPARIFLDSMSDLMGHWIPDAQIEQVLDVCRRASWHTFQLLTKNAPRLKQFSFPANVWVGVSAPPSRMIGRYLSHDQQKRWTETALNTLDALDIPVRWMSIEPLSFDIAPLLEGHDLQWLVVGAATKGRTVYQPERAWVQNVLDFADSRAIPVFFKGKLRWEPWRADYPVVHVSTAAPDADRPAQLSLL